MNKEIITRISTYRLVIALVVLTVFVISMLISPQYTGGDQIHYRRVYDEITFLGLKDAYEYYRSNLDSRELVHFIIVYFASPIMGKDLLMSVFNAGLAYSALKLCRTHGVSPIIAALIPLSNYYFFTMYFSAERLKFAMIFVILGINYINKQRLFFLYCVLAVLSHAQTIIIYASVLMQHIFNGLIYTLKNGKIPIYIIILPIVAIGILAVNIEQISSKFISYYQDRSLMEINRSLIFLMLTLYVSKNKINAIIIFIPILIATFLVGGDRVNMLSYFTFLYYALQYKRGVNAPNIILMLYFAGKTILFVDDIVNHGTGFPEAEI